MCQNLVVRKRLDFPIVSLACQSEKEGRFVESVESFSTKRSDWTTWFSLKKFTYQVE
jgi:hypothetical protein